MNLYESDAGRYRITEILFNEERAQKISSWGIYTGREITMLGRMKDGAAIINIAGKTLIVSRDAASMISVVKCGE